MSIRAIETKYRGYNFRSRLEARWAVFFDSMNVHWEYEPEGFVLPSGGYLPDFYLPDNRLWIEIKPDRHDPKAYSKAKEFRDYCEQAIYVAVGDPMNQKGTLFCWDQTDGSWGTSDWQGAYLLPSRADGEYFFIVGGLERWISLYSNAELNQSILTTWETSGDRDMWNYAAGKARGARFEHGQCGAVA